MAHLLAPPNETARLTKEDAAVIQAEKKLDCDTREQLARMYGDSKFGPRRVQLQRPAKSAWKCKQCGHSSVDIRRVCGKCLCPETHVERCAKTSTPLHPPSSSSSAELLTITSANSSIVRCYRIGRDAVLPEYVGTTNIVQSAEHATNLHDDDEEDECDEEEELPPPPSSSAATTARNYTSTYSNTAIQSRAPFTHFVSIPIGTLPAVRGCCERLLEALRTRCSSADASAALEPVLVSHVGRLHVTMLMLTLPTRADVDYASELLRNVFKPAWEKMKCEQQQANTRGMFGDAPPHRPRTAFRGLRVMPPRDGGAADVRRAGVVFVPPRDASAEASLRLVQSAIHTSLRELILDAEEAERSRAILHLTVMNKKWRSTAAKRTFNATSLLSACDASAMIGGGADGSELFEMTQVELNRLTPTGVAAEHYFTECSVDL